MTFVQFVFHLANLLVPALALALVMPLAGRWVLGRARVAWPRRVLYHAGAGTGVLVTGLLVQGQDGRMATYAVLVLVLATLEWALHRGWRR